MNQCKVDLPEVAAFGESHLQLAESEDVGSRRHSGAIRYGVRNEVAADDELVAC